jgi:uncharacterized protein
LCHLRPKVRAGYGPNSTSINTTRQRRAFGSGGWTGVRGHDLTGEMSLDWGDRPKVVITGYASSGFDVQNTVKYVGDSGDDTKNNKTTTTKTTTTTTELVNDGTVHYNGSILVFPYACFLWHGIESIQDITMEKLTPIMQLHRPKLEYLFLGCPGRQRLSLDTLKVLQDNLRSTNIVVEQMGLANAIGTFNILNAEDRLAAVALIVDRDGQDDMEEEE